MMVYSIIPSILILALFWGPRRINSRGPLAVHTPFTSEELLDPPIITMSYNLTQPLWGEFKFHSSYDLYNLFFIPFSFLAYSNIDALRTSILVVGTLANYATFFYLRWTVGVHGLPVWFGIGGPLFILVLWRVCLPRKGKIFTHFMYHSFIGYCLWGFVGVLNRSAASAPDDQQLLITLLVLPLIKEFNYAVARWSSRLLYLRQDILGDDGTKRGGPRRTMVWMFFMWITMFNAFLSRLFITRLSNHPFHATLAVVSQAVFEVGARLTMAYRMRWTQNFKRRFFKDLSKRRRTPVLVMPSILASGVMGRVTKPVGAPTSTTANNSIDNDHDNGDASGDSNGGVAARVPLPHPSVHANHAQLVAGAQERLRIENMFIAMLHVGESFSEYVSIAVILGAVYLFADMPLYMPLDVYNDQPRPFEEPIDASKLIFPTLLQLIAEIIVDTLCNYYQSRAGFDLVDTWKAKPKYFMLFALMSGLYASTQAFLIISFGDDLMPCTDLPMCECWTGGVNGIKKNSVRASYCKLVNETHFLLNGGDE
jgi:hypothetical protein